MALVRAREVVAVRHPEHGQWVTLNPAEPLEDTDPLVREFAWAFATDEQLEAEKAERPDGIVESVVIEKATADPGKRRRTTKK